MSCKYNNCKHCGYKSECEIYKENAELKEELKTAYRKGMRHIAKALKDYDRTDGAWTDYFEHTVDKVLQREQLEFEEYGTLAEQLTKAKKLLKQWVELYKPKLEGYSITPIQEQTERFLSEVEK
jgi:2-iminoacetate synthase ThiH